MKKIAVAVMGMCVAGGSFAAPPDWNKVTERKIKVFYPGQASLEWVMNKADHSAVPDIVDKKRACAKCHEGDANEIGDKIVAGKPVGRVTSAVAADGGVLALAYVRREVPDDAVLDLGSRRATQLHSTSPRP